MNINVQEVLTTESDFKSEKDKRKNEMWEIRINREKIKELAERKAIGPNGVSGYILKECRQEMAEPIHDIIVFYSNRKSPQRMEKS